MISNEQRALAGEYVLGLLEGAELAAFEAQMAQQPHLSQLVDRLALQMQALDDTAAGEANPAQWAAIEARLADVPQLDAPAVGRAANRNTPKPLPRWVAMAASVVVGIGVGYLASQLQPVASPQPRVIAVLIDETDASPGAIIEAFADDSVHLVPLEDFDVPAGQVLQVWTKPNETIGPVSLGTLGTASDTRLRGPKLPQPVPGQLYEITLEPAPGSPTGKPTGPILVKGFAKAPI
jgi:anti-sigma-K factor RskA